MNKYLIMVILSFSAVLIYLHNPVNAQQSGLISLMPDRGDLKINEEKVVAVKLGSESKISGFDLKFQTSGGLMVSGFDDTLGFGKDFDPFNIRLVTKKTEGSNSRIAYVFTAPSGELPEQVTVYIKVRGDTAGQGRLDLDENKSQILDESGNLLKLSKTGAGFNLNSGQSSQSFISPEQIPAAKYPVNAAVLRIKTRLYGAGNAVNQVKASAVIVGMAGESKFETPPQNFYLTGNGDGTYSGEIAFQDFKDGVRYSLMLKADKYLLKRICDINITEEKPGQYRCQNPGLSIKAGSMIDFDFSGINLLPGDLGIADGHLNGYDLGIVRNNLNSTEKNALSLADLNYDNVVDSKDLGIIQFIAANTGRRSDQ